MSNKIFFSFILFAVFVNFSIAHQDFDEYAKGFGYPVEVHTITTDDGYILKAFRVQTKNTREFSNSSKIIYLQHGILDSSDSWVINSSPISYDTVFYFADLGYDVWCGNSRGNYYSRNHVSLNPDKDKDAFWNFSFKEMGKFDLPAVFDYIGKFNPNKINYVGHSQGTSQMFYALTQQIPIIENKLANFFALAPVVYLGNMSSPLLSFAAQYEYLVVKALSEIGIHELLWRNWLTSDAASAICKIANFICGEMVKLLSDKDPQFIDESQLSHFMQYEPSGASLKSIHHYAQLFVSNKFQDFDYGKEGNLAHYKQETPPEFSLANIKRKIYAFAGDNDELADEKDVSRLKNEMGDYLELHVNPNFGHLSYLFGNTTDFNPKIHEIISNEAKSGFLTSDK